MATKTVNCACQSFEFGEFDGGNEAAVSYDTGCGQTTTRTFAMGHDAKLVGFLVRAELAGEEIRMISGGVAIYFPGAVGAAQRVSDALAVKAQAQLDAARARVAKKAAREASKAARKSAKARDAIGEALVAKTRNAKIKVGRWTYDATIKIETGEATYISAQGVTWTKAQGQYIEVA